KGMFFENVVAQQLVSAGHELIFNRFEHEGKNHGIDFLLSKKNEVIPVKVKSAGYRTHRSLDIFRKRYGSMIEDGYIVCSNDLEEEDGVLSIPAYMTMFL
ncbi:MAG: DUF4143 domain-containing protein, partial [archaeon]|nr:DUF4143 domain-containing protein [archaeon]